MKYKDYGPKFGNKEYMDWNYTAGNFHSAPFLENDIFKETRE